MRIQFIQTYPKHKQTLLQ